MDDKDAGMGAEHTDIAAEDIDMDVEDMNFDVEDTYIDEEMEAELSRISEEMKIDEHFENLIRKYEDFYYKVKEMIAIIDTEMENGKKLKN